MTDNTKPEALRLAEILEGDYCPDWFYEQGVDEVTTELRRQHARIAELEAQLSAIGAGGVSDPLMGCASIATNAGSEPVASRAFLERALSAMEGVIDVADRQTDEFEALRSCVIDLTLMLFKERSQREARPCHVFTVRKAGPLTEWEPTTMAFALPDGEHALYTHHSPPEGVVGGLQVYRCKIKSRKQIDREIPREQQGWWADVAAGQKLLLRQAVQSDLDRCTIGEKRSRNPADYMCETHTGGSLVSKVALEYMSPEENVFAAPPTTSAGSGKWE